jgi:hypothetical protein
LEGFAIMAESSQLTPPEGIRPGEIGVVLLGRVIMGDIAATVVDLAQRQYVRAEETAGSGWLISVAAEQDSHALASYEKALLNALPADPVLLAHVDTSGLEAARKALIHDGVARGWLRHLHHDERAPAAEELAVHLRAFQRQMRQLRNDRGPDALSGALLPYALHFGLVDRDATSLSRFGSAWVHAFADLPGWHRVAPKRVFDDVAITINSDHDLRGAADMAWAAGMF